jgi:large subunit ribosomal protein L25
MAETITLAAEPRAISGKQNRQLRRAGITPIVVYGRHTEPVSLQVETRALERVLHKAGGTHVVIIQVAGEKGARLAMTKDVQRHITRLTPVHADFIEVQMDQLVTVEVPVVVEGEPNLVKSGEAMLEVHISVITVEAMPQDFPQSVRVDVSDLADLHSAIRVADLDLGDKVKLLTDPETLVVHLSSTAAAYAAATAMEAAATAMTEAGLEAEPEPTATDEDE